MSAGATSVSSTLNVAGQTTLSTLSAGATTVSSTLNVAGQTTLSALSAGATSLSSTLNVAGQTSIGALNAAAIVATANILTPTITTGSLTVTSGTSLANTTTTTLTSTAITATSNILTPSITTANISANGTTTLATTTTGSLTSTALTVSGGTSLATTTTGSLTTTALDVTGSCLLRNNVEVNGNFTVSKILEKINIVDIVSLVCDMNLGNTFTLPLTFMPTSNYAISITNVPLDTTVKTITLISRQGTTSFFVNNLKVSNVSNQFILGSASTIASPIFNGGTPTFTNSPCVMVQCFNVISMPDTSNTLGTYSRFVTSSVNSHF